jgi:hypothetical protein
MFDTFRANPSPATATPIVEVRRNSPFSLMMAGQANQALATALDLLADNLDNWSQVNGLTDSDKALIQGMIDAARPAPKAAPAPKVEAPAPVVAPVVDVAALPALRGSEKQVAWAAQIRLQVADWLAGQAAVGPIWVERVWGRISIQTDSRFWIDNFRSIRWNAPRADVWRSFGPWIGA